VTTEVPVRTLRAWPAYFTFKPSSHGPRPEPPPARETTLTLDWLARRLNMGATGYAAPCLRKPEER